MHPVEFTDYVWQTVRIGVLLLLSKEASVHIFAFYSFDLDKYDEDLVLLIKVGFFTAAFGFAAYFLIMQVFFFIMKVCFQCEILGLQDQAFLYDTETNHNMICCASIYDKWDNIDDAIRILK